MAKFNHCPNCKIKPENSFDIHECKKCKTLYCYNCGKIIVQSVVLRIDLGLGRLNGEKNKILIDRLIRQGADNYIIGWDGRLSGLMVMPHPIRLAVPSNNPDNANSFTGLLVILHCFVNPWVPLNLKINKRRRK